MDAALLLDRLRAADPLILSLLGGALVLLLLTYSALRNTRAELARIRQALVEAQIATETARERGAERDARLATLDAALAEERDLGRDAQHRAATAAEAVARLEAAEARLRGDLTQAAEALRAAGQRETFLHTQLAAQGTEAREREASLAREIATLKELRAEMTREFQALAQKTLAETGGAQQERLTQLLTPFREQVGRFETELRAVHQSAGQDRAMLGATIRDLTSRTEAMSAEAVALTRALRGEKQRQGAWGESRLEEYLGQMGFEKGIHYTAQDSRRDEDGALWRPDIVLKLPGDRRLVIDSKVSLNAYMDAVNAEDDATRQRHLRDHSTAVRRHVDLLSAKGYESLDDGSVDWVLLFMPIEGAVSAAWAAEADLGGYAMERRVGLAYPTTLLLALATARQLMAIDLRNKNAEAIAQRAGHLYDKLAGIVDNFNAVGAALRRATDLHDDAVKQLTTGSGNLVGQVEKLKALGARTRKSIALPHEAELPAPDTALDLAPDEPRRLM